MVFVERKRFTTWRRNRKNQLWSIRLCFINVAAKMLIVLYKLNILKVWKRRIWKNWNCAFLPLCCMKSQPVLNKNINFSLRLCWKWISQRKRSWKLHLWTDANIPLTLKSTGKLLPVLCNHCCMKILLLSWSKTNWENFN